MLEESELCFFVCFMFHNISVQFQTLKSHIVSWIYETIWARGCSYCDETGRKGEQKQKGDRPVQHRSWFCEGSAVVHPIHGALQGDISQKKCHGTMQPCV